MKHLKALNKYLWRYRWHLGLGFVFIVISDIYGVEANAYVGESVNKIFDFQKELETGTLSPERQNAYFSTVLQYILIFLGYQVIKGFFLFCQRQTIILMSRRIEYDMKNDIYQKYQELPTAFYQQNATGDIMNRISEDVGKVRMYLGPGIMYTINLAVLLIICITKMLQVNAELTLYVLAPLPIMTWLVFKVSNIINKKSSMAQTIQSSLSTRVQEDFTAIRLIKTFGRMGLARKIFNRKADDYKHAGQDLLKTEATFTPIMTLLVGLSTTLTICIGGIFCINGKIEFGTIPEFVLYIQMLTWPFASVGWISSMIQRAAVSQQRINEFMQQPTITSQLNSGVPLEDHFNAIQFSHVSFNYPTGQQALKNISFELKQGQTIGIIGKTGSGKTTLANLLSGTQTNYQGTIKIGQHELTHLAHSDLRHKLSCVPQEAFLFSDTIYNNIAFGSQHEVNPNKVEYYAKKAVVHDNIVEFEKQYETVVGERGITLSGGQKQRITIARALIREPKILIFDDCLSAVDAETEKQILGNLMQEMIGKTTLLISHRVSTVQHADEIIVLDQGEIVERGKHADLIQHNGLYNQLYKKQLGHQN